MNPDYICRQQGIELLSPSGAYLLQSRWKSVGLAKKLSFAKEKNKDFASGQGCWSSRCLQLFQNTGSKPGYIKITWKFCWKYSFSRIHLLWAELCPLQIPTLKF